MVKKLICLGAQVLKGIYLYVFKSLGIQWLGVWGVRAARAAGLGSLV